MAVLNQLTGRAFDLALVPLGVLPALVGLAVVSFVTAAATLLVFRAASDQAGLVAVKRSIHAAILEMRLFSDDLSAVGRAQLELLRHHLTYLRLCLVPTLWLVVPLALAIAHLQFYYGYDGLVPGRPALVKAHLRPADKMMTHAAISPASSTHRGGGAALEAPDGIRLDTAGVWLPAANEIVWQVTPIDAGEYHLRLRVGQASYTKTLEVSDRIARRSPVRVAQGFVSQLLYPSEAPLPAGGAVRRITVAYPEREIAILGWRAHWIVVYVALSTVFVFALKRRWAVTI